MTVEMTGEIEMQDKVVEMEKVDEKDAAPTIPFDRQVKVVLRTKSGVTLRFQNKPFGFSFTDANGSTTQSSIGAYVSGYSKANGYAKDMANVLPLGFHLTEVNGKDVSTKRTGGIKSLLDDMTAPCEVHFQQKKLFPDDALGAVTKSNDTVLIEFRFKPFGFAIVDEKEGMNGFGAKVKLQPNGSHLNPELNAVLPENAYIININGRNVMSLNFKTIGYLLRTSSTPCRVRFGFQKKRYCYHYDYDSTRKPSAKFSFREDISDHIPSDSNGAHFGFEGITISFKSLPLGLRLDKCKSMDAADYRRILGADASKAEGLEGVVDVGANVIGYNDPELRDVVPIGAQLMGVDKGGSEVAQKVRLMQSRDIEKMLKSAEAPISLAFMQKVDDLSRPLVMSKEDKRVLIQFRQRPFGLKIVDVKGEETGYGARVKECKNRQLARVLPDWCKIIDVNGRRVTGLNFSLVCRLIEKANMPAEILFEVDDFNPNAVEFDPETMPMDTKKADGVMVEFVRMPFGHITTLTMKDKEAAKELEQLEKEDDIVKAKYPKDCLVIPSGTGFKGRTVDFLKRPFGFDIQSIEKVPEKKLSKDESQDEYIKALEGRLEKLERMVQSGAAAGKKSVQIQDPADDLEDKPLPTGYGAVISRIRNDFLTNEIDEMGQILQEGWHLAYIEGKDVRFADTAFIAKLLAKSHLPLRLSWVKEKSLLYPPEEPESEKPRFEVLGAFKDMSNARGCTIKFMERPLGFSVVDECGGYRHTGAAVRSIQNEDLKKVLRRFARIVSINDGDVKYMNHGGICNRLKSAKMPMTVSFVFYHSVEIKNYTISEKSVVSERSSHICSFSKCEALNITFDQRPFGMAIFADDPYDKQFGHGATVGRIEDERLAKILKVGSRIVSVGHHHVAQMKHQEIVKIIDTEKEKSAPFKLGFTYDALAVAQQSEQKAFTDSNITMVKSGGGMMIIKVTQKPLGIKVVESRPSPDPKDREKGVKGIGAMVHGYNNPLVKNIIPKGSKLISVNGIDVQDMNYEYILQIIQSSQFPMYMIFTMNQKVKTRYGFGLIEKVRDDGFRVVKMADFGATAYLRPEEILDMTEDDEDALYEQEAGDDALPDVTRPDFLRLSTQSNLMDMVKRRESQMTSKQFLALNQRLAAASGTSEILEVDDLDDEIHEFDEDYEVPSDSEDKAVETEKTSAQPGRSGLTIRLTASGVSKLLKDEDKEDAEDITEVGQGRPDWVLGSKLEVHSTTADSWFVGTIIDITHDEDGEWLTVLYELPMKDGSMLRRTKETQRFYEDIRPLQVDTGVELTSQVMDQKAEESGKKSGVADLSLDELAAKLAEIEEAEPLTGGGNQNVRMSPRSTQVGI